MENTKTINQSLHKIKIRSKNLSAKPLSANNAMEKLPFKTVVRIASITDVKGFDVELNTIEAVKNASNKITTKKILNHHNILTPSWWDMKTIIDNKDVLENRIQLKDSKGDFRKIILKKKYGSKGKGMVLIESEQQLLDLIEDKEFLKVQNEYFLEYYVKYAKEYRLHCSPYVGCFYCCRKMLIADSKERWYRNDSNSVWYLESNPSFDAPRNFENIKSICTKAVEVVGLDIGAVDVKIPTNSRTKEKYAILEINSGPSLGKITLEMYKKYIPIIAKKKFLNLNVKI